MGDQKNRTVLPRAERVTLYLRGGFGWTKVEARWAEVERGPYAQHLNAFMVRWVRKGARKQQGIALTFEPVLVVLEGWGHASPRDSFDDVPGGYRESRHSACSPAWDVEGREFIAGLVADGAKVLFDAADAEPVVTR